jgi:hypothetical protein
MVSHFDSLLHNLSKRRSIIYAFHPIEEWLIKERRLEEGHVRWPQSLDLKMNFPPPKKAVGIVWFKYSMLKCSIQSEMASVLNVLSLFQASEIMALKLILMHTQSPVGWPPLQEMSFIPGGSQTHLPPLMFMKSDHYHDARNICLSHQCFPDIFILDEHVIKLVSIMGVVHL